MQTLSEVQAQIRQIDRNIDGIRSALYARGRFDNLSAHGWQLAWDRNPDLHARETELFRQRGELQQQRDALIESEYRAEQRRQRRTRRAA